MTAMFASLDDRERRELANRLRRAGERLGDEANALSLAAPSVLACYNLPREGYHDFYSAAIEASMLSVEVWRRDPVCRTCGFEHPPEPVCPRWAPEPADLRQRVESLMNRGYAGRPAFVPTGTGWPL